MRNILALEGDLFFADLCNDGIDEADDLLVDLVAFNYGIEHGLVVYFVCASLDHNDFFIAAYDCQLQVIVLVLLVCRVDNDLTVHKTDRYTRYRSIPRHIRDGYGN